MTLTATQALLIDRPPSNVVRDETTTPVPNDAIPERAESHDDDNVPDYVPPMSRERPSAPPRERTPRTP